MRGLQRLNTVAQLDQLLLLWDKFQSIQLTAQSDSITWRLTADGKYSAKSAYAVQFLARIWEPGLEKVWSIRAEGKTKFFIWLLQQNRNWTADRLRSRGWPHDDRCCLCDQHLESALHLALQCPFAKEVWARVSQLNTRVKWPLLLPRRPSLLGGRPRTLASSTLTGRKEFRRPSTLFGTFGRSEADGFFSKNR